MINDNLDQNNNDSKNRQELIEDLRTSLIVAHDKILGQIKQADMIGNEPTYNQHDETNEHLSNVATILGRINHSINNLASGDYSNGSESKSQLDLKPLTARVEDLGVELKDAVLNMADSINNISFDSDSLEVDVNLNDYGLEVDISDGRIDVEVDQSEVIEKLDGSIDAIEKTNDSIDSFHKSNSQFSNDVLSQLSKFEKEVNSLSYIFKTFMTRVLDSLITKGKDYDIDPDNEKEFRIVDIMKDTFFWSRDTAKTNAKILEALETQNRLQKEMILYMVDMKKNVSNIATSIHFVKNPLDNNR